MLPLRTPTPSTPPVPDPSVGSTRTVQSAGVAARPRGVPVGRPLSAVRRRRPRWILAGLLAMVIGALGSVVLWTQVADTSSVLRLNRTVYRGEIIRAQDLSPVTVGRLNGLDALPADAVGTVVGQPARTDIAEGSLLTGASVGREDLPTGTAVVGLRLAEGRVPRIPLDPGSSVLLVEAAPEQTGTAGGNRAFRAEIHRPVETSYDQVAVLVDVAVARRDAEEVARLAAADRIVLVRGS